MPPQQLFRERLARLRDVYEPGWRHKEANFKPQESIKDPHRNARNFLETECKHPDGPILRYHYGAWYWWDGASYHVVPVKEINARVTSSVKGAFDRESIEAQKRGDTEGMVALPVTTAVVRNVLGALESLVLIPSTFDPPCWIDDGHLWEPCDVLPAINGLYYLPLLLDGVDKHIKPTPLFFSTFALDYEIRLDAPPPLVWLKFLDDIWGKDSQCIETLQEFMGYCPTRHSRNQRGVTNMAFIPENGWWLWPPSWRECHEHSIALLDQVRQPHRLHPSLLRPGHFQGPPRLVGSPRTRILRRLCSEGSP